ncbi:unnamed protein product [Protopolystoma xenopodis]|uniref:Uncharacterized protein n=1 Tax=Protopolystoma xenopodis TaxID=117903 RepID=A0A448XL96_9PLAT|nr:unnamed protein product [Protopolystoma xenopodis]
MPRNVRQQPNKWRQPPTVLPSAKRRTSFPLAGLAIAHLRSFTLISPQIHVQPEPTAARPRSLPIHSFNLPPGYDCLASELCYADRVLWR